jgi:hypothetical protein
MMHLPQLLLTSQWPLSLLLHRLLQLMALCLKPQWSQSLRRDFPLQSRSLKRRLQSPRHQSNRFLHMHRLQTYRVP